MLTPTSSAQADHLYEWAFFYNNQLVDTPLKKSAGEYSGIFFENLVTSDYYRESVSFALTQNITTGQINTPPITNNFTGLFEIIPQEQTAVSVSNATEITANNVLSAISSESLRYANNAENTLAALNLNIASQGHSAIFAENIPVNTAALFNNFILDGNGLFALNNTVSNQTAIVLDASEVEFSTEILDAMLVSQTETGSSSVTQVGEIPTASASLAGLEVGSSINGTLTIADADTPLGDLTFSIASQPLHGSVTLTADGRYSYTPHPTYAGSDSFTYQVTDPQGNQASATVSIDVLAKTVNISTVVADQRASDNFGFDQQSASVSALTDGGYVIVFQDFGTQFMETGYIKAQQYDAQGNKVGAETTVATIAGMTTPIVSMPEVTGLSGGGFVVAWAHPESSTGPYDIMVRQYDSQGDPIGTAVTVNTTTASNQTAVSVAALNNGGYVVAWQSDTGDGSGDSVWAQIFAADGSTVASELQLNSTTANHQNAPAITGTTDGGFIAVWQSEAQDGSGGGIYGQLFSATGNRVGSEFLINTTTTDTQTNPTVTTLMMGNIVVAWESLNQDGSGYGLFAQLFDASGNAIGSEFQLNTTTAGNQTNVEIASNANDGFIAVWQSDGAQDGSGSGIYAQEFDGNGNTVGSEILINSYTTNDQQDPDIAILADGSVVLTWQSTGQDGSWEGVYSKHFQAVSSGSHSFTGGDGNDSFIGGSNADTLVGGAGDDILEGAGGADYIDGGAGSDTVSYASSDLGITINLSTQMVNSGDGTGDTLISIENVIGSQQADNIQGSNDANRIDGGAGDDLITAGGGDDILLGGRGSDVAHGEDGSDTYIFSEGDLGSDTFDGGAGGTWIDKVSVTDTSGLAAPAQPWTIAISGGPTYNISDASGVLDLGNDASGTITLGDGSELAFTNLEQIIWGDN
ncbi:MAG: hypothetical protein Tsb005_09860 [Gammaproteobacteria bacterium]